MQVVILAAGLSSRFYPYTQLAHKSFFPLMGRPLIEYTLESIKKTGITEVIVVVSKNSPIPSLIGDGTKFDISIRCVEQQVANGQGDALLAAKDYLKGSFFLLNAHHFDFGDFKEILEKKQTEGREIVLLGKHENVAGKFGVAKVEGDRVIDLIEKPEKIDPESDIRVMGIYLLNSEFLNVLETTPPEHYHLEKAIATYASKKLVRMAFFDQEAFSLKYPWDLLKLKKYLLVRRPRFISEKATIASSAQIEGAVVIEENVKVLAGACIKGPSYIGRGSIIGNNALVREYSIIESNCTVGMNAEVKNSILGQNSSMHSGSLEDSVVGHDVKIGALFCSANVRIDRGQIIVNIKKEDVNSGLQSLGVCIGDGVKLGSRVTTMPGILIGQNSIIGPSTTVMKNVAENTKYYTKFREIIEKKND